MHLDNYYKDTKCMLISFLVLYYALVKSLLDYL